MTAQRFANGVVGRTSTITVVGLNGHVVDVEAVITATIPGFVIVGLPDVALGEARDRVRAAIGQTGLPWPNRKIVVNLSPAAVPKSGTSMDLAIATAILAATGTFDAAAVASIMHLGELGLDGCVRPVRGILPAVAAAVAAGRTRIMMPAANAAEGALVPGAELIPVTSLADVARHYGVTEVLDAQLPARTELVREPERAPQLDLADVVGHGSARRALEIAAAGGHHLLMVGPPGSGKTMLAARMPSVLPELDDESAVEVTSVRSVAGSFDAAHGLVRRPPFVNPHHSATVAGIIGGGSGSPRPGAVSFAHRGVLFLDEAPEFGPRVLQSLREPLESGSVTIQRSHGVGEFPARFQLVLAANPCPCGNAVGKGLDCSCTPMMRRRYFGRLSGPLLDRVDIQMDVLPTTRAERGEHAVRESSAVVAARVARARERQATRLTGTSWRTNSEVPGPWLREHWRLGVGVTRDLDRALDLGRMTMRGYDRTLRLAWTIADLSGETTPTADHVAVGMLMRTRGLVP